MLKLSYCSGKYVLLYTENQITMDIIIKILNYLDDGDSNKFFIKYLLIFIFLLISINIAGIIFTYL